MIKSENTGSLLNLKQSDIDPELASQLAGQGVDLDLMVQFLNDLNAGKYDNPVRKNPMSVPPFNHPSIIDRRGPAACTMALEAARSRFEALGLPFSPEALAVVAPEAAAGTCTFDETSLRKIGINLYPKAAYGVLNGGMASSYADIKKNSLFDPGFFESFRERFESLARSCRGVPKGIMPAYINPDGSPGYSFLLLKLRMLLRHKKLYLDETGALPCTILPAFQLTSLHTDIALQRAFREYTMTDELRILSDALGCPSIEMFTETQTLMAAITHSSEGFPRRIFDRAGGKEHTGIALPGGHGQNFALLAPIYRKMYSQGIRYVWIGNIDNLGYTVDPVALALFALSRREAAFEVSARTSVDVKGGILVAGSDGRITCEDIGPALNGNMVHDIEAQGHPVYFNCGIGLFDLERLVDRLPSLPFELPLRLTDQDKDAGRYAQAEQLAWEIIGLIDDPLFFAVEKANRFISAKLLMETLLTSFPPEEPVGSGLGAVSRRLHRGMGALLGGEYGLELTGGCWKPVIEHKV